MARTPGSDAPHAIAASNADVVVDLSYTDMKDKIEPVVVERTVE